MSELSEPAFSRALETIRRTARPIELALSDHIFGSGDAATVLKELTRYQNGDGGFGNGLELDFSLPSSSPMATSHAFHYLDQIDATDEAMVESAIRYLEATYDPQRHGWLSMSREVNDHPHAPWWHYDETTGGTAIDHYWGNPSADIIGILCRYKDLVKELDVDELAEHAVSRFEDMEEYESQHEVYCYIRMHDTLPKEMAERLAIPIAEAVSQLLCVDVSMWNEYYPRPLDFVPSKDSERFGVSDEDIEINLGYLIDSLEEKGRIEPHWSYRSDDPHWDQVKRKWTGTLTLRALQSLRGFGRLP
jgi:hypothetical protein